MSLVVINDAHETFTPTSSGAIATVIWEIGKAAAELGSPKPCLITRSSNEPSYPWNKIVFVDYPKLPQGSLATWFWRAEKKLTGWVNLRHREYALRVIRAVKALNLTDPVFVLMNETELAVELRRALPRSRIVHWFHNQLEAKDRYREAYRSSKIVSVAVSDFTARWIEEYYSLSSGSVLTLPNGVDSKIFCPAESAEEMIPRINFLGRTGIEKAPDLLLKACLRLAETNRRFELQLLGSNGWGSFTLDSYQEELRSLVAKLRQLGVRVECPGHIVREAVPSWLRKAHIHVVPSRWDEPFGLTTLEGMASGLATVGSRTGATPEVIGDAGFVFARDSVDELSEILGKLVEDKDLRRAYGTKARQRSLEFSWKKTWNTLTQVVDEATISKAR